MSRLHPRLLSLDNQMEAFWQEYKHKQGLPVHPQGKQGVSVERATGKQESGDASAKAKYPTWFDATAPVDSGHGCEPRAMTSSADSLWASSHISFHQSDDLKSEQEFVDTGNCLAAKYQKKHWIDAVEWYWRLLAVAVFGAAVYVYGRLAGAW